MKLRTILNESALRDEATSLINQMLKSPVIKKFTVRKLHAVVEEILDTDSAYTDKEHKYMDFKFKRDFVAPNKYRKLPDPEEFLFKCKSLSVDNGGVHLLGYHSGYKHDVYMKPEDLKEFE